MSDEVAETTIPVIPVSDTSKQVLDSFDPSPSLSPMPDTPVEADDEDADEADDTMWEEGPATFQQRMDNIRDSFRETYQVLGNSTSGAAEAKVERDKAQVAYDGKAAEVSNAATSNLEATRGYIRILQEHEAVLVGHGQA